MNGPTRAAAFPRTDAMKPCRDLDARIGGYQPGGPGNGQVVRADRQRRLRVHDRPVLGQLAPGPGPQRPVPRLLPIRAIRRWRLRRRGRVLAQAAPQFFHLLRQLRLHRLKLRIPGRQLRRRRLQLSIPPCQPPLKLSYPGTQPPQLRTRGVRRRRLRHKSP